MVSANAIDSSSGRLLGSTPGQWKRGTIVGMLPTVATVPHTGVADSAPSSTATAVPAASAISMDGQRGSTRLTTSTTASVAAPTSSAPACTATACRARCTSSAPVPCLSAGTRPSRSVSECTAISAAAPLMKPRSAEGEMKLARPPSRSTPISHCISPTSTVTASASWM